MATNQPQGIERCRSCMARLPVEPGGRVPPHDQVDGIAVGRNTIIEQIRRRPAVACPGGNRLSREEMGRRQQAQAEVQTKEVAAARDDATVAYDAALCGNPAFARRLPQLLRLALTKYRQNPPWSPVGKRPPRHLWNWQPRSRYAQRGDVVCTICGELLLGNTKKPRERNSFAIVLSAGPPVAVEHLTICGLRYLAGLCEAVAPWTKQLPVEHRQEIE